MPNRRQTWKPGSNDPGSTATVAANRFGCQWEGAAVLRCQGDLDTDSRLVLRHALDQVAESIPVVVDLSDVGFLDCGAVGELVRARTTRRAEDGDLHVREPSAVARRVLSIVGLDDLVLRDDVFRDDVFRDDDLRVEVDAMDEVHRPAAADASAVVDAWAARVGDLPDPERLVFCDPVRLVSSLLGTDLLGTDDRPQRSVPSHPIPGSVQRSDGMQRYDGSTVSSAVLQLLVLDDLLRLLRADPAALLPGQDATRPSPEQRPPLVTALISQLLAELEALTLVDPLTGLLNRRALDRDLSGALTAARRHGHGLVVVMVDVDGMKSINDGLGHAAGDVALRDLAESLRAGCGPEDGAYRMGGDEFVLVLHGIGTSDVNGVMDRIRLRRPAPFTWGCAEMGAEDPAVTDAELSARLLGLADHAMLNHRIKARVAGFDGSDPTSTRDPADDLLQASRDATVIEQARGLVAERLGMDLDVSMDTLRSMARQRDEPVAIIAARLVDGTADLATSPLASARPGEHDSLVAVDGVGGPTPDGG